MKALTLSVAVAALLAMSAGAQAQGKKFVFALVPKNMNNPDVDPNIIKESSIVISVPNDGEYYLGKQRVAREQLSDKVDTMLKGIKNENDRIVYIKSGVNVSYGDVVTVINEVRKLGVDKIGLVADKKKGGAAAAKATT